MSSLPGEVESELGIYKMSRQSYQKQDLLGEDSELKTGEAGGKKSGVGGMFGRSPPSGIGELGVVWADDTAIERLSERTGFRRDEKGDCDSVCVEETGISKSILEKISRQVPI